MTKPITMPELRRMKELAEAGMPCGSIATAVKVDFGTDRNADAVRGYLIRHYGWRAGKPRGNAYVSRRTA